MTSDHIDIDLGDGHLLRWLGWNPDPALNPHYADKPVFGPDEHYGATIEHSKPDGSPCEGAIAFDTAVYRYGVEKHNWRNVSWAVQSWEPLTISPSVLCSCGDHGFIRNGRWVRA